MGQLVWASPRALWGHPGRGAGTSCLSAEGGRPLLECTPSSPLRLPEGAHTLGAPQACGWGLRTEWEGQGGPLLGEVLPTHPPTAPAALARPTPQPASQPACPPHPTFSNEVFPRQQQHKPGGKRQAWAWAGVSGHRLGVGRRAQDLPGHSAIRHSRGQSTPPGFPKG